MPTQHSGRQRGQGAAGFTLLEALITITVFAVVLVAWLRVYDLTESTYVRGMASADVQQSVRALLDLLARDVRQAGFDPSNAIASQNTGVLRYPVPPVLSPSLANPSSELRLVGDLDGNGATDCVAYRLINGQIRRWKTQWTAGDCPWPTAWSAGLGGPGVTVVTDISALKVTYLSATGSTPTDLANWSAVKRVKISVTAKSPVQGRTFSAETEVALRQ